MYDFTASWYGLLTALAGSSCIAIYILPRTYQVLGSSFGDEIAAIARIEEQEVEGEDDKEAAGIVDVNPAPEE